MLCRLSGDSERKARKCAPLGRPLPAEGLEQLRRGSSRVGGLPGWARSCQGGCVAIICVASRQGSRPEALPVCPLQLKAPPLVQPPRTTRDCLRNDCAGVPDGPGLAGTSLPDGMSNTFTTFLRLSQWDVPGTSSDHTKGAGTSGHPVQACHQEGRVGRAPCRTSYETVKSTPGEPCPCAHSWGGALRNWVQLPGTL